MRLTFQLRFHTVPGQSLFLTGNHPLFGNRDFAKSIPLRYLNDEVWSVTLDFPTGTVPDADITYNYVLRDVDGSLTWDWGSDNVVNPAACNRSELLLIDSWNHAGFYENAFYTDPFQKVLLRNASRETSARPVEPSGWPAELTANNTHTFKVKAPLLAQGQTLCLLGGNAALHNWDTSNPILMRRNLGEIYFTTDLELSRESFPITYKYGVYDTDRRRFLAFENLHYRSLNENIAAGKRTIVNDGFTVLSNTSWKGAGVAIPVFSLRSETSFGIGEFTDLKLLADWCHAVGLQLIQILPINDTTATHTWTDSYPYAAVSAFALNPVYLNLARAVGAPNRHLLEKLEPERQRLNSLEEVDYEAVLKTKLNLLRQVYPLEKSRIFRSKDYREFFAQNKHWLVPYAVFCHLREEYGTADFQRWPAYREFQAKEIAALAASPAKASAIEFHYFLQYHLHRQLQEAVEHAHARGVILKGDIPIGVSRNSADAWQRPDLYCLDTQAGAPPDDFSAKGQNWSFPTYNWPRMKEDGFTWWKQRLEQMGRYFDAFRIDHILGFFRIWTIPMHAVEGILGYFVPALPVRLEEFQRLGIWFDYDRYLKPYITDEVLHDLFGAESELVRRKFLDGDQGGRYVLKPGFATQRQVEEFFAKWKPDERSRKLKLGLFDLISNVILLKAEGPPGQQFHFRFAVEDTHSFKALDQNLQAQLKALYVDYFFRRQDAFWAREAMEKLPALKRATNMLICGEDLGLVPACVPEVMKQLGLLTLEVQRMPKKLGGEFSSPKDAPYLSVVTPGTHDMSTIRGWWEEDAERTQKFYQAELGQPGDAPPTSEPWINKAIILQHLDSPAMWSIFQLQDLLGMDEKLRRNNPKAERINVPANPQFYWRYRMHLTMEKLLHARGFNEELERLIRQTVR